MELYHHVKFHYQTKLVGTAGLKWYFILRDTFNFGQIFTKGNMKMIQIMTQNLFNPQDFYPIFQAAFQAAYNKFKLHIPNHPTRPLFRAARLFDPKYIHM